MTAASGFDLHPEAPRDITEIWEDVASDNPAAWASGTLGAHSLFFHHSVIGAVIS